MWRWVLVLVSGCFLELSASHLPNAESWTVYSDHGGGLYGTATSVGIAVGVFVDTYGIGLHANPGIGQESMDQGQHSSEWTGLRGPSLRLDADLPLALGELGNLRVTGALAFPRDVDVSNWRFPLRSGPRNLRGSDVFAGITASSLLHDVSLSVGVRRLAFAYDEATSTSRFYGLGAQARLMFRIGPTLYYAVARRASRTTIPPHERPCGYVLLGYRCP